MAIARLDTHSLDDRLLRRLSVPRSAEDPLNKYFFSNFLGVTQLSTLKYILEKQNIRCVSRRGLSKTTPALCIALQSSPGFVVGFHLLMPEAEDDIIIRTYSYKDENAFYYPRLDSAYVCRKYDDLVEYRHTAAMAVCMGGAFNAVIPV